MKKKNKLQNEPCLIKEYAHGIQPYTECSLFVVGGESSAIYYKYYNITMCKKVK